MEFLQGKSFNYKEKEVISAETALKKKMLILFYFTTLESEGCRAFDAKLKDVYQEALKRKLELGVIIVSCDTNKESYLHNIKNNYPDWYSVQFDDELLHILIYNFGITHVPALIVLAKSGALVSKEGTKDVETCGINVLVTWLD